VSKIFSDFLLNFFSLCIRYVHEKTMNKILVFSHRGSSIRCQVARLHMYWQSSLWMMWCGSQKQLSLLPAMQTGLTS
jgi:hypothetical protein